MIRAFLAVELSATLRDQLASFQQDLKRRITYDLPRHVRVSWVRPQSLHLTLKFLGDIPDSVVEPLRSAMAEALALHHSLVIPLERLGGFPHMEQPRVLWIGPGEHWERGEEAKRLAVLHQTVEVCCQTQGLGADDRPLTAHLTMARIKEGGRPFGQVLARSGQADRPVHFHELRVDHVALMQSDLRPTGSVYTRLWEVRLGAG